RTCSFIEVGVWRNLERNFSAACRAALTQLDRQGAELAGQIAAVLGLGGDDQADYVGVVSAKLIEIRGLKDRVSNSACLDHRVLRHVYYSPLRSDQNAGCHVAGAVRGSLFCRTSRIGTLRKMRYARGATGRKTWPVTNWRLTSPRRGRAPAP